VGLEGEGAATNLATGHAFGRRPVVGLRPIHGLLFVDPELDVVAFNADAVFEPHIIGSCGGIHHVGHVVETARFLFVAMRCIDLAFETERRPAGVLIGGVEVNPRVRAFVSFHHRFEVKVFELRFAVGADVVEVTLAAADLQDAIDDLIAIGWGVLRRLPTREGFAVEEADGFASETKSGTEAERRRGPQRMA